ncbi:growth factor receptor-bound protein 7 isoform X2 [Apteryx mantelli]|uniref:Growth factor receptor-bound protein 7 isoform X2 n=1 Tax=Apteryx mantelli TaxID=2696672 RepID=A0ABM4FTA1_9AVES
MDGGAQPSSPPEPPGTGGAEREGAASPPHGPGLGPGERDAGEGPPAADVKRSQPLFIHAGSRKPAPEEPRASSLPCIPNPFPELCSPSNSPILSSPPGGQGPPREGASHVVKVFSEDGACRSLEASAGTTARQLCEMLVRRAHALHDHSWALVELHQHLALERCLEDHESVVEVQGTWPLGADSRFVFRKNFAKYELFKSNGSLFPEVMVSSCLEANKSMAHSELIQLPRGPGLPAPAGGRPQGLEALLLLPAPLGALLLHQGHVQGPPAPAVPRRPHRVQHLLRDAGQEALRDAHRVRLLHQALQGAERHEGPEAPVQRGRAEPDVLDGGFPPLQVRHAALPQLPAGAGPAQPAPLDRPHAPAERVGQRAGGHGLLGVHGPGDREPQRGADGRPGGGAGLEEEDDAPVQPAGRLPELPAQRRHPPHPALVPRAHLPRGHPAAHRPAGPGGWRLPGAGEPAQPQGLRAVPVPPAEGQALSHPAERGGGPALLHHGRRADPLRRPHPAGGVSPDQPGHPALQAPALLHLRGPLSPARHRTAGTARGQHGTVLHGPARHDGAQPVRHSQHGLVQPAWPSWHGPAQHSQHSRCSQHGTVLHGTTGHSLAQPVRHSLVQPARPARHGWARSCTAQPGMVLHSATGHSWCSTAGTAGTAGTALRSAAWPELGRPLGGGSGGAGTGTRQGAPSQAAPPPVPFPCAQPGSAAGAGTPPGPPHSRTFRPGPPQRRPPALLARHGGARPCG